MPASKELVAARTILDSGEFEMLIGTRESWDLEYKSELWKLTEAEEQFEFAKDIAAMANSTLGIIVIGLSTITLNSSKEDIVNGFKLEDIRKLQNHKLREMVEQFIYPPLAISISAKPYHRDPAQGVLILEVLPESESMRPYVVKRVPCGKDNKTSGRGLSDRFMSFPRRRETCVTDYPHTDLVDWARAHLSKSTPPQITQTNSEITTEANDGDQ